MIDSTVEDVPRLRAGFSGLARVLTALLGFSVLISVVQAFHSGWGGSSELARIADTHDLAAGQGYDDIDAALAVGALALLVLTGVVWLVWQRSLAAAAPEGSLRRTPGWHVGSWFIPFASLVLPFQNIRDLWKAFVRSPVPGLSEPVPGWLGVWWATWIGGNLLGYAAARGAFPTDSLDGLRGVAWIDAVSAGLTGAAGALALLLVVRLSAAATAARD